MCGMKVSDIPIIILLFSYGSLFLLKRRTVTTSQGSNKARVVHQQDGVCLREAKAR